MEKISLDRKMEIAYGIKLHALEGVVTAEERMPKIGFGQKLRNAVAFWHDDTAIMLLTASLAIMGYLFPVNFFDPLTFTAWLLACLLIFVPVALVFTWFIMIGFHQRRWSFVRVFSTTIFLCLAFLCVMATYFP